MKTLLLAAVLAVFSSCAFAAQCYPEAPIMQQLALRYAETPRDELRAPATDRPDFIVHYQVWANDDTGTWTFFGVANGVLCVLAAGKDYKGQTVADLMPELLGTAL